MSRWVVLRYRFSFTLPRYEAKNVYYGSTPNRVAMETGGDLMPGEFTDQAEAK